jgi:hypothetical protein
VIPLFGLSAAGKRSKSAKNLSVQEYGIGDATVADEDYASVTILPGSLGR